MSMWILQTASTPAAPEAPDVDNSPLTFRLSAGAIKTIGRASGADFIVDRALVSRVHCRLTADDEKLSVEDLSSTNGTFVNDRRVERAQIASGDRLRVGRIELTVEHAKNDGHDNR
jgi:pSer/pThr/pTyr-binding forkhead associated (FHA) protein